MLPSFKHWVYEPNKFYEIVFSSIFVMFTNKQFISLCVYVAPYMGELCVGVFFNVIWFDIYDYDYMFVCKSCILYSIVICNKFLLFFILIEFLVSYYFNYAIWNQFINFLSVFILHYLFMHNNNNINMRKCVSFVLYVHAYDYVCMFTYCLQ